MNNMTDTAASRRSADADRRRAPALRGVDARDGLPPPGGVVQHRQEGRAPRAPLLRRARLRLGLRRPRRDLSARRVDAGGLRPRDCDATADRRAGRRRSRRDRRRAGRPRCAAQACASAASRRSRRPTSPAGSRRCCSCRAARGAAATATTRTSSRRGGTPPRLARARLGRGARVPALAARAARRGGVLRRRADGAARARPARSARCARSASRSGCTPAARTRGGCATVLPLVDWVGFDAKAPAARYGASPASKAAAPRRVRASTCCARPASRSRCARRCIRR